MIESLESLKKNVHTVLTGKDQLVDYVFISLICEGHLLMEDVPGTGKTMLAKIIAQSIDGSFKRIQFTPDLLPSDVSGIKFFNPKTQSFELNLGPVMTNVLLADEINRATPRAQSSLLEVMEERQVTIEGETFAIEKPFLVIATQNPIESHGTFSLPEAQMDRFFMQISCGYPSFDEEREMLNLHRLGNPLEKIKPVIEKDRIVALQEQVKQIHLSDAVAHYLLEIVRATRSTDWAANGVSPRGTLALMRSVQAKALISGRDYVVPEDVRSMAVPVLAHRLVLSMEGELHTTKQQIIEDVLEQTAVPVESGAQQE
ncbi:AAA family ATPase [Sporolactobacillus inulinus]|jgi:MoxR-like ATPase|uniref:Magnesium chelatase n=2 Tax=Sporolactobacillus inulinus TaxID=2078 RepID=A0A0U1QME8_9BACL|nr:MoxR family ATPase [Sporolactobacillus inulinus]KLI01987.1 magnesium chelatase [Sporolactobacillus inulinus CASD]GEB75972.1 magnesium chelatase [Sporolactobacillus inulinus]